MMYSFNIHVRWRIDKRDIFICDCKKSIDLKIDKKYESTLKKFEKIFEEKDLNGDELPLYWDLLRLKILVSFTIRKIKKENFEDAMNILDDEFNFDRVRDNKFLFNKFLEYPSLFIGAFIGEEIIGIICGFPREDYLLLSELAVESSYHKKGIGTMLVKSFEKEAKNYHYNKISAGAQDNAIDFYYKMGYTPELLIQYSDKDHNKIDFKEFDYYKEGGDKNNRLLWVKIKEAKKEIISRLKKKYPLAHFQYIFFKTIKNNPPGRKLV